MNCYLSLVQRRRSRCKEVSGECSFLRSVGVPVFWVVSKIEPRFESSIQSQLRNSRCRRGASRLSYRRSGRQSDKPTYRPSGFRKYVLAHRLGNVWLQTKHSRETKKKLQVLQWIYRSYYWHNACSMTFTKTLERVESVRPTPSSYLNPLSLL